MKKITVITTYQAYPPRGGGPNRVYYLYKEIAKKITVEIVCLVHENEPYEKKEVAPDLFQIKVPKSAQHAHKEWEIQKEVVEPVTDIAMLFLCDETKAFIDAVIESSKDSSCIVCEHPYLYEMVKKYLNKPVIHDSHNVEYLLKKEMLPANATSERLLNKLFKTEKRICNEAVFTIVCSKDDALFFKNNYGIDEQNLIYAPNGVDLKSVNFTSTANRVANKKRIGLGHRILAVFMGAWHRPNIDAVFKIFEIAEKRPDIIFLVVGSVGFFFAEREKPENVGFLGEVSNIEKDFILSLMDISVNPMMSGSGTNMKMLDYLAAGVPVISTKIGCRGLNIPNTLINKAEPTNFFENFSVENSQNNIFNARQFISENYSWEKIGSSLLEVL